MYSQEDCRDREKDKLCEYVGGCGVSCIEVSKPKEWMFKKVNGRQEIAVKVEYQSLRFQRRNSSG